MADEPLTSSQRQLLEARHTWQRLVELRVEPVRGGFDAAHLKEINRRIFQDLSNLGFTDVTPGQFRGPVPNGNDWIKTRKLETVGIRSTVAYSPMDVQSRSHLAKTLAHIDPSELSKLSKAAFIATVGKLYSEIDYIHPFPDGNSRTLREFTRQLALESGYVVDWDRFGRSPAGRDILYIARDLSVNRLALTFIQHEDTRREILFSMDQLEGNRTLPDLLTDVVEVYGEPSMDEQLAMQEKIPASADVDFVEPSMEEQLREQESGGYAVKVNIRKSEAPQQISPDIDDHEPGMDS